MGEDVKAHGLIKWDVKAKTGALNIIQNDWAYITIHIQDKKTEYLCAGHNGIHNPNCKLAKYLRVRILYKNTPESFIGDFIAALKLHHKIVEYSYQNNEEMNLANGNDANDSNDDNDGNEGNVDNIDGDNKSKSKSKKGTHIDIVSPDLQNKYIVEYLKQKHPNLTNDDYNQIKQMNIKQNEQLTAEFKNRANMHNGFYKLKRIEFSNLFSFGSNNIIDFTNFKGVVGIIAPNHMGKSAILDIIIYTLFDKFTRKGSVKDMVNTRRTSFCIKMEISMGQWTYIIEKSGTLTKTACNTKVAFSRINDSNGIIECLDEDSISKTKDKIGEYFGYYEDIIHTSFSIQNDNCCFIDSENTGRKKELERIMKFEIITELYMSANKVYNKHKTVLDHIDSKLDQDLLIKLHSQRNDSLVKLGNITKEKETTKETIKLLNIKIVNKSQEINTECATFIKDNKATDINDITKKRDNKNGERTKIILQIKYIQSQVAKGATTSAQDTQNIDDIKLDLEKHEKALQVKNKQLGADIKELDVKLSTIYKQRKPMFNSCKPSELRELLDSNNSSLEATNKQISKFKETIDNLNSKTDIVNENNLKLAELEKILNEECDLPEKLNELLEAYSDENSGIDLNLDTLNQKVKSTCVEWIRIMDNSNSNTKTGKGNPKLVAALYDEFNKCAQEYYFITGLINYRDVNAKTQEQIFELETQKTELEKANSDIKKGQREIKNIESQIKTLDIKWGTIEKAISNIKCDMDNIEYNAELDTQIDEINNQRVELENLIEKNDLEINTNRELIESIHKLETLELKVKSIEMEIEKIEDILRKYEIYAVAIENNKLIYEELTELKDANEQLDIEYSNLEKKYNIEQMNLSKFEAGIEQYKKDNKERKELEHIAELWEYYKNALKQLPYVLLDKIKPILEKRVNDMLSLVTDFTVVFDMTDNKIDIYLNRPTYNDRQIIINNASGFERFISSLAIRLALLDISNLPKINFLAIDEGWSSFDNHNINNVNVIMDYLKAKFDFILTISHIAQIKEHCDKQIFLRKDNLQYSVITYE